MRYNFDIEIGCMYWSFFERNLKKAVMFDHVDDYIMSKKFLSREYCIKGASENFVDFVKEFLKHTK